MQYIYIFEGGETRQSNKPPTFTDVECLKEGILQIMQISLNSDSHIEICEMDYNENWCPIPNTNFDESQDCHMP